jgi:hypothetical protein
MSPFSFHFHANFKRVGQHISLFESGVLQEVSFWEDGWATGTLIRFRPDASKELERDFGESGGRTRCWTERCYSLDSELYSVVRYRDSKRDGEWIRPDIKQIEAQLDFESVIEKALNRVFPENEREGGSP